MISLLKKRPILTIIAVVGVMLLPLLDVLEVSIMEARNFITAREMLTDGNWILTTMNGEPRYEKPPLPTWLTAISASIFGLDSVWGLRFPAVLMVILLGCMIFLLSRKLSLSKAHSLINGVIAVTSLYVILIIFEAPWDIYAHAFMLSAIYFMYRGLGDSNLKRTVPLWIAAALFFAASVLSKGPVSVYVLFLPFLIAYLIIYRRETGRNQWLTCVITLIFGLILGFSWYAYVRFVDPETFHRIAATETGNWSSYNVRPFYYYWSFFIQSGLWAIPAFMSLLYPYMKSRVSNLKVYQFTLLWVLLAVVLLSIIPEKKSRYLMPVLIPLAINSGFYIAYVVRCFKGLKVRWERGPVYFNFLVVSFLFTALPVVVLYLVVFKNVKINWITWPALLILIIAGLATSYFLIKKRLKEVVVLTITALIFAVLSALSLVKDNTQNPNFQNIGEVLEGFEDDVPLYSLQIDAPEVLWNAGRKINVITSTSNKIDDQVFYLLACAQCEQVVLDNFTAFNSEYMGYYDLNFNKQDARAYKERKAGKIYLMKIK